MSTPDARPAESVQCCTATRMTGSGHFRQIDPLPTLSAFPLRSDRVRTFAPQRIDAVCHKETYAAQQRASYSIHLVGAQEQRCWSLHADRFRGLQIHDGHELRRLLDREVGRFRAF